MTEIVIFDGKQVARDLVYLDNGDAPAGIYWRKTFDGPTTYRRASSTAVASGLRKLVEAANRAEAQE